MKRMIALLTLFPLGLCAACGDDDSNGNQNNTSDVCAQSLADIPAGDPDGHPDPYGAAAAGQARAGRITSAEMRVSGPLQQHEIRVGDFVLANERIAVVIAGARRTDGYSQFGGEIMAVDAVGPDGRPLGRSTYRETLVGFSNEMIFPEDVTVLRDGSDGGPAVVRVRGTFQKIPYLSGPLAGIFSTDLEVPGYYDYVLEPGAPSLKMRFGILNNTERLLDLDLLELYGFFQASVNDLYTRGAGFDSPSGEVDWVVMVNDQWSFATRSLRGMLRHGITESGFSLFFGEGFDVPPCSFHEGDYLEIAAGGPGLDGILEVLRELEAASPWRPVTGRVLDAGGQGVAGAQVLAVDEQGALLTRARAGADGSFALHVPEGVTFRAIPVLRGFPAHPGQAVGPDEDDVTLTFGPAGWIHVTALDASDLAPIPVRVQVIPEDPVQPLPDAYGIVYESRGRLHQFYSVDGTADLRVPYGRHRVLVSRGYEYELLDTTVTVDATADADIEARLRHSVDSTGYLCADFHVHTAHSPDSKDAPDLKVAGQVADGLDIAVFTDHEWVTAPAPYVADLGLDDLAFGFTGYELTTFEYGHFNVLGLDLVDDAPSNGALNWFGRMPGDVFAEVAALPGHPLLSVNHPRSPGIGGYFSAAGLSRETGTGNDYWDDHFDTIEAMNGSSFEANRGEAIADWFALLNLGHTYFAVGGSDNHFLRKGPTGYPRNCIYFGHDDPLLLEEGDVPAAVRTGHFFVTGGIYVTATGPGGEPMGGTVTSSDATVVLSATVQAASWVDVKALEVIVDGDTQEVIPLETPVGPGPAQRFDVAVTVPVPEAGARRWVVLHAYGDGDLSPVHPGRAPFGVTNPIFIQRP